jgi:tRNA threonylcarbamoyladenosine biosynthesis protein TsaB
MIVLGFDTSTPATAVALRLADGRTTHARDDPPAGAHPGHATRLLDMAHELLGGAGVAWGDIDRIAVGVGPGTFTGLRVGVATARGLAQSLSIELVGVSSPRALAVAALASQRLEGGGHGAVLAVIDARRGEAFAAAYELGDRGEPSELAGPRALPPQELASVVAEAEAAAEAAAEAEAEVEAGGAAGDPPWCWLAVGDGALRFRDQLEAAGVRTPPDSSPLHLVSAEAVCELGAHAAAAASLQEMVPDYRRRPDAELALERAGTATGPLT